MTRVTFLECMGLNPHLAPMMVRQHEPARFMGMRSLLIANGDEFTTVDAAGNIFNVNQAAEQVIRSRPDVLGLSGYMNRDGSILEFNRLVLERTRKALPHFKTIIGGPITTHKVNREEAIEVLSPDFAVIGEGEIPIAALIASGFKAAGLEHDPRITLQTFMRTTVLKAIGRTDLDSIDFKRPPEWFNYALQSLDWQRFCPGACIFCAAQKAQPTYVSPKRARAELEYLIANGKRSFFQIGPEFTANPKEATAIVEELLRGDISGTLMALEARIPEMGITLADYLTPWQKFAAANTVRVYLGYETGVPEILQYLGKVGTYEEARNYLPTLLDILDMDTDLNFLLSWMLTNPKSTRATVLFDLFIVKGILEKYERADMNLPSIYNNMRLRPGSKLYSEELANYQDSLPEPLKALYYHMDSRANALRKSLAPGRTRTAIARWKKTKSSNYSADGLLAKAMKMRTIQSLHKLIWFLLNQLGAAEAKKALSEARAIARSFDDGRILDLFMGQLDEAATEDALAEDLAESARIR